MYTSNTKTQIPVKAQNQISKSKQNLSDLTHLKLNPQNVLPTLSTDTNSRAFSHQSYLWQGATLSGPGGSAVSYGCGISPTFLPTHLPMYAHELTWSPTHAVLKRYTNSKNVIWTPKLHAKMATAIRTATVTRGLSDTAKCPLEVSNTCILMMLMMRSQNFQVPACSITTN